MATRTLVALVALTSSMSAGCLGLAYEYPTTPTPTVSRSSAADALAANVSYASGLAFVTFTALAANQPVANALIAVDVPSQSTTNLRADSSGQASITVSGRGPMAVTAHSGSAIVGLDLTIP